MLAVRNWREARATFATPKKRKWKLIFIEALREHGVVSYSARIAGIDRAGAYKARKVDAEFALAWDDALEEGVEELERAAIARAKKKSDTLLIFLLKCRKPDIYGERREVTHRGGDKPVGIRVEYVDYLPPDTAPWASGGYRQQRDKQRAGMRSEVREDTPGD